MYETYSKQSKTFRLLWVALGVVGTLLPPDADTITAKCLANDFQPGPPADFYKRSYSDRFAPGTKPVLIKNARIWTGAQNGTEVIKGGILLDRGLIKEVGHVSRGTLDKFKHNLVEYDAEGRWVTPGIVDLHSHIGDASSPELEGASGDDNSLNGPILPWLRSLDGLNTHDDSYNLSIAGGVTTSLVLPGSANAIGGQGFVIKLRRTAERSPTSLLLEPPYEVVGGRGPPRWRHMKHACGENPDRVYRGTRMDTMWAWREAYNKARQIKEAQDAYCHRALRKDWAGLGEYPEDIQWEALVATLRGKVKVQTHCYEAVDLDDIVRLSNEFEFPIAAFHHAHEAYLVPDVLKRAYGHPPAVAIFATNARYKREAYRGSEFAPRILAENGLQVVMKSDHPVLNSRYLLYEAQQAFYYGLPENLAIASVTSTPATIMGLDHRIGYIKAGWDADVVVWDSHPLALGATPTQVFIDGIPQLHSPHVVEKPKSFQSTPKVPNFDKEAVDAVTYEGLPPLELKATSSNIVLFANVSSVYIPGQEGVQEVFSVEEEPYGVVVVEEGRIQCLGRYDSCVTAQTVEKAETIDLQGGSISPGLVSFGSPLGLVHIEGEISTADGYIYDPLESPTPKIIGGDAALVRAADGLEFASRDALLAYRFGVTKAVTAPINLGFISGLGVSFSTGAAHRLEEGAVIQEVTALHVSIGHTGATPSVSTQVAALRHLLLDPPKSEVGKWSKKVTQGIKPLVVEVHSADIIATLILLKKEVEAVKSINLKMTITGASEAHLLAAEIAEANIGVIVSPSRPFPTVWESRRILQGPPLTRDSAIAKLLKYNITVGLGIEEKWSARNLAFDVAWAALETDGSIDKAQAIALGSTNVEKLLGGRVEAEQLPELVARQNGDLFDMSSKVVAVISPRQRLVHAL
ncbi:carbohydrate esterase family 9 protein [Neolentinus lepideus HHB14362 ss-1]|uniref:Carbohydrate esterase family 9 protein n=1 Tax=Neolentinus lepideus HHB14362 ss-1 TaxID=1314782 RepID=A0A165UZN7_9AGAM|nr:carbohydrate esterase family 9 protein [Neolentinus lepideus HHB14362 ss-1]